ncbi:hypothetical protein M9434_003891 [Picochlorum sp. BPE23]|nr:hypothetical protein M9434_003891 [Picochlorum sp. BPE23]
MPSFPKGASLITTLVCLALLHASLVVCYSDDCGKPGGPCNPGYDAQFGSGISKDNLCPDDQPCQEGYFCIADTLNVDMPEYESNYCVPQPDPCGGYLQRCCAPEFTCDGEESSGVPLTCQVTGGPYFTPGSGVCMPNPKCGAAGEPCCQPWGHRDYWGNRSTADGIFSNPSLCNGGYYCNFHSPSRQSPINGTCVANQPDCGLLGKPCCIETTTTFEAYDSSMQWYSCEDTLGCNLGSLRCERERNTSISELNRLCGQPYGACTPAFNGYNPESMFGTQEDFPELDCSKPCPENYLCSVIAWNHRVDDMYANLSMCIGPVDPECGTLDNPCCPWTIDEKKTVDGDLHCRERDSDGNLLQCRSLFALNRPTDISGFYTPIEDDSSFDRWPIQSSICTPLEECGSENKRCCHEYQDNYIYANPKSPHAAGDESLLCDEGLYCRYDNFTGPSPQGTCVANDPECGTYEGSPCCTLSLTRPWNIPRGINSNEQVTYCRNESLSCYKGPPNSILQFGFSPVCIPLP